MSTTPSTPETPDTVRTGQQWRDNDQRTKNSGEFTVETVFTPGASEGRLRANVTYARVRRHETGKRSVIAVDRMLRLAGTQRGYTYLGMEK